MRFCSRRCAATVHGAARRYTDEQRKVARRASGVIRYWRIKGARPGTSSNCLQCGGQFEPNSVVGRLLCSDACRRSRRLIYGMRRDTKDRAPRPCPGCGIAFSPARGSHSKKFCSRACGDKECKRRLAARRRARMSGASIIEFVNPTAVFERDGWRCYLCRCNTPRELQGSQHRPNAPSMDHVIPVAAGGEHSYANLRCACRACNSAKQDNIIKNFNDINDIGDAGFWPPLELGRVPCGAAVYTIPN